MIFIRTVIHIVIILLAYITIASTKPSNKKNVPPEPEPIPRVIHNVQESIYSNFAGSCQYVILPAVQSSYYLLDNAESTEKKAMKYVKSSKTQVLDVDEDNKLTEYTMADFVKRRERLPIPYEPPRDGKKTRLRDMPQQDTLYYVLPVKPHDQEIEEYLSLPDAYTWVNDHLAQGIVKGEPMAEEWANREDISWTVPLEHPRSNKTQCLKYTRLANKRPIPLYSDNPIYHSSTTRVKGSSSSYSVIPSQYQGLIQTKQDLFNELNEFYLIYKQYAIIHETGVVSSQCGYFQAHETCEMKFKFLGKMVCIMSKTITTMGY